MKRLKTIALTLSLLVVPAIAFAQGLPDNPLFNSARDTAINSGFPVDQSGAPTQTFVPAWTGYVNGLLLLMGALFFIQVLYGGWLWFSARGNEEQVTRAKKMILNAVIAIALVLGARIIVEIVIIVAGNAAVNGS